MNEALIETKFLFSNSNAFRTLTIEIYIDT